MPQTRDNHIPFSTSIYLQFRNPDHLSPSQYITGIKEPNVKEKKRENITRITQQTLSDLTQYMVVTQQHQLSELEW